MVTDFRVCLDFMVGVYTFECLFVFVGTGFVCFVVWACLIVGANIVYAFVLDLFVFV